MLIICWQEESYEFWHIVKQKEYLEYMKMRKWIVLIFMCALFTELWILKIVEDSQIERLSVETVLSSEYRAQEIGEKMLSYIEECDNPAERIGLYLLESKFGYQKFYYPYLEKTFVRLKDKWRRQRGWDTYKAYTEAIWNDVKYFPVSKFTKDKNTGVTYQNSWGEERTYGGQRSHEGTDIMASENVRGLYPIVSMTDGVVENKGWLEKGGYRIGIKAPSGAYFYYAHLDSYAKLEIGDEIKAGDIRGFMGDSGYGPEGTTGKFPVHLHLGIYIYPEGEEISVNPYWVLRWVEEQTINTNLVF